MITTSTLRRLISAREIADPPDVVVLGFRTENPDRYGRLVLDADGKLERIVEVSEAHTIDKPVELYNAGVMAVNGAKIIEFLEALSPENGKKEYYLTDIVRIALKKGGYAQVVEGRGRRNIRSRFSSGSRESGGYDARTSEDKDVKQWSNISFA